MKKVALFSVLLIAGLALSQVLPNAIGPEYEIARKIATVLTMIALSFIMIHVGFEFDLQKSKAKSYAWDYFVAFTAASFPWLFVTLYFVYVMSPPEFWSSFDLWKETLLAGRFAAPTSAGVLFSMLAAAGLSATWLFKKARILAIFDDLDTVLLMIPLKMLIVGLAWQLGIIVVFMLALLWLAWSFLHKLKIPASKYWVLGYSVLIVLISEFVYWGSGRIDPTVPIHLEVLLPAFVLGALIKRPEDYGANEKNLSGIESLEAPSEKNFATAVSAIFMVLVGLSLPSLFGASAAEAAKKASDSLTASFATQGWDQIAFHVLIVTIISNIGKMFPAFVYRKEAHWKERLAVAIGMWPRGEVGAGVLVVSISYGIGGPILTVALLSLTLNLALTGVFIWIVKKLISAK